MPATESQGRDVRRQLGHRDRASGLMCPGCQGGRTHERSLIGGREGLNLWGKCMRNSCGWWGQWDITEVGGLVRRPGGWRPKRFHLDTLPLTEATVAALEARYLVDPLTMYTYGLRQGEAGRAVYCPVRDPLGGFRGWARRWLDGTRPKVKGYQADTHPEGAPWQAWFRPCPVRTAVWGESRVLVAVEDVFSAMRLAEVGITAVSLLGTSLSAVKVAELRNERKQIVVALDADAYGNSIGFAIKYLLIARRLAVDIKDMTEEQLTIWTNCLYSSLPASRPEMPAKP